MKHSREFAVGIVSVFAVFLLYFGFNFLKGVNIFSSTSVYHGRFAVLNGLTEQSPVYIRGYKVGQVDKISYDFTQSDAFVVTFSINKDILLPLYSELCLCSDGLLGGSCLELVIPLSGGVGDGVDVNSAVGDDVNVNGVGDGVDNGVYFRGDTLPTVVIPGLVESLQNGLLADLSEVLQKVDTLLYTANVQLEGNHLKSTLENVDRLTADLRMTSANLKRVMSDDIPVVVSDAKSAVSDIKTITANVRDVDLAATISKVDAVADNLKELSMSLNSKDGTVGMLLNDRDLYVNLNEAIQSVDSLLVDLKTNPKRYVHFSLFGAKKDK